MMNKKFITWILGAGMAFTLTGCAADTADTADTTNTTNTADRKETVTQTGESALDTNASSPEAGDTYVATKEQVENNGTYFVKIGDRIYFRAYNGDALEGSALAGQYMSYATGAESDVMYYDLATKETKLAFSDQGFGEITYLDGRLYMSRKNEDGMVRAYSCLLDGSDASQVGSDTDTFFAGCDNEDEAVLYYEYDDDFNRTLSIYQPGKEGDTIKEEGCSVTFLGAGDGYVIYEYGNDLLEQYLGCYQIETKEKAVLGKFFVSDESVLLETGYYSEFEDVKIENGKVSFAAEVCEGSGHFLAYGEVFCAELGVADSLKSDRIFTEDEIFTGIYSGTESVDVASYIEDFVEEDFEQDRIFDSIEYYAVIGTDIYAIMNSQIHDEASDIGWRYSYARLVTNYLRIDTVTGEVTEMLKIDAAYDENGTGEEPDGEGVA